MRRLALCACVPAALGAFDFGFLAQAAPTFAPRLGAGGAATPWLFSASSFAYAAAVLPASRATAALGPSRALAAGLAASAVAVATR